MSKWGDKEGKKLKEKPVEEVRSEDRNLQYILDPEQEEILDSLQELKSELTAKVAKQEKELVSGNNFKVVEGGVTKTLKRTEIEVRKSYKDINENMKRIIREKREGFIEEAEMKLKAPAEGKQEFTIKKDKVEISEDLDIALKNELNANVVDKKKKTKDGLAELIEQALERLQRAAPQNETWQKTVDMLRRTYKALTGSFIGRTFGDEGGFIDLSDPSKFELPTGSSTIEKPPKVKKKKVVKTPEEKAAKSKVEFSKEEIEEMSKGLKVRTKEEVDARKTKFTKGRGFYAKEMDYFILKKDDLVIGKGGHAIYNDVKKIEKEVLQGIIRQTDPSSIKPKDIGPYRVYYTIMEGKLLDYIQGTNKKGSKGYMYASRVSYPIMNTYIYILEYLKAIIQK